MKWCFFEKIETCLPACVFLFLLRIPDDADQRSGLMPITHSERCRSVIPGDADHSFRGDPDQLITIVGTVIAMPRNVFHRAK